MAELKPIRTEADYQQAMAEIARLWGVAENTPDGDRLDVLATLVDVYESEHDPLDLPDPIEAIKFRMEQQGLTRKDLEPLIGTRTRVAELLNRRRSLSIRMIRRLHEGLGIPAEVLIRPSGTAQTSRSRTSQPASRKKTSASHKRVSPSTSTQRKSKAQQKTP